MTSICDPSNFCFGSGFSLFWRTTWIFGLVLISGCGGSPEPSDEVRDCVIACYLPASDETFHYWVTVSPTDETYEYPHGVQEGVPVKGEEHPVMEGFFLYTFGVDMVVGRRYNAKVYMRYPSVDVELDDRTFDYDGSAYAEVEVPGA